jgi:uncharacterized protein (TIGR00369 family)
MSSPFSLNFADAQRFLMEVVPHTRALGTRLITCADGHASGEQPYDARLIGDPDSGVIAGGVVTTLIDSLCGLAVLSKLRTFQRVATLDLRVDYLRPATPQQTLHCTAECYRVTRHVAFVRATVHDGDAANPLATASATFMLLPDQLPANLVGELTS